MTIRVIFLIGTQYIYIYRIEIEECHTKLCKDNTKSERGGGHQESIQVTIRRKVHIPKLDQIRLKSLVKGEETFNLKYLLYFWFFNWKFCMLRLFE